VGIDASLTAKCNSTKQAHVYGWVWMWKPMEDSSLLHLLGIHKSLPNEIPTKAAATEGGAYLFGWGAKGHPSFCGDLGNSRHLRQLLYMGGAL